MGFRIIWKSTSTWAGTTRTMHEDMDIYETRDEAEAALKEMNDDASLMEDVHAAAVEDQGVEGWLEIEGDDE